jgi:hydroxymethylglutaryl-CoA lyase
MKIKVFEVGPRDGLQNELKVLTVEQRAEFIRLLLIAGHGNIEVGAFVNPEKIPQMAGTSELLNLLNKSGPVKFWCLVPNLKGFQDAMGCDLKNLAVFTAASETFNKVNTNAGIDESLKRFETFLPSAVKNHLGLRGYISTGFACPYEGKIKPSAVIRVAEKLFSLGVSEVSIGDTIGVATPNEVKNLIKELSGSVAVKKIALHFHDTRGTALANVLAGLESGVEIFDSSCGGLGGCPYAPGAAGNVATDELVYMLEGMGLHTGINLDLHLKASIYIQSILGRELPSRYLKAGAFIPRGKR